MGQHHGTDPGAVISSLSRALRSDGQIWIDDLRFTFAAAAARAAASGLGRRTNRTLIRTGYFPAALFQWLAIEPC